MANKGHKNLIPQAHTITVGEASAGGKKSGQVRKQKKTIADYLRTWADSAVEDKHKQALRALGLDEEATNRTLLVLPLIKKANSGDIKALQMIIDLLGEDKKKDLEIKKLREEIRLLKAETQKITSQFGDDREIEDMTGLAEMLAVNDEESTDD